MIRLGQSLGMLAAACIASGPACATKDFSAKASADFSGGGNLTLFGNSHTIDNTSLDQLIKLHKGNEPTGGNMLAAVPEPAGWLMMLVGFGVLGMVTRRATPHPLPPQHTL